MKSMKSLFKNGSKKRVLIPAFAAAIIIAITAAFLLRGNTLDGASSKLFEVKKMDLHIIVTESGVLQAKESEKIIPDIDSEAKIIKIVDEGIYVKKGTELVELDKSGIEAALESLEIELISAEADLDIADEEVKKYKDGEYPQQLKELDFAVEKAVAKLQKAKDEMPNEDDSDIYSKSEITDAKIAVREAEMNLDKAKLDRSLFVDYTHKKNMLERTTKANTAREKYNSKVDQKKTLKSQLEKMILKAPCDGLVVYETGGGHRRREDQAEIKVGATVYKGQTIMILPNVSKMQVLARIHEVDIQKIKDKQKVDIRIDAFPDMRLTGQVLTIGALARDRDWRTSGVKVFDVTIDIDGEHQTLRPGMTATVDIKVDTIKKALVIPIESVFEDPEENEKYCFVREGGEPVKRVIELGASDDNFVQVLKGLKEGEHVYQYDAIEEAGS